MPQGVNEGVIAPNSLIIADGLKQGHQRISGAIWISGATIEFMPHNGSDTIVTLS